MRTKWEYTTLVFDFRSFWSSGDFDHHAYNDALNERGEKGWELVSVMDTNHFKGATRHVVVTMKRPMNRHED